MHWSIPSAVKSYESSEKNLQLRKDVKTEKEYCPTNRPENAVLGTKCDRLEKRICWLLEN